jgi:hypothetical protein
MTPEERQRRERNSRIAAHESWARTKDRSARTAAGRAAGPASVEWHIARLDPERFADATDEQRLAAGESARKAYYQRLAVRSRRGRGHA